MPYVDATVAPDELFPPHAKSQYRHRVVMHRCLNPARPSIRSMVTDDECSQEVIGAVKGERLRPSGLGCSCLIQWQSQEDTDDSWCVIEHNDGSFRGSVPLQMIVQEGCYDEVMFATRMGKGREGKGRGVVTTARVGAVVADHWWALGQVAHYENCSEDASMLQAASSHQSPLLQATHTSLHSLRLMGGPLRQHVLRTDCTWWLFQ